VPLLSNIVLEFLSRVIRQEEEETGIQTGKEKVKLSLFSDDMSLYLKELNNYIKKLLHLINTFGKLAG
jgi:hypothetical protein